MSEASMQYERTGRGSEPGYQRSLEPAGIARARGITASARAAPPHARLQGRYLRLSNVIGPVPLRSRPVPPGPADQWMAKSDRVYPSALTVGWMKLFLMISAACASAALISGPVTFGLLLTCANARFCAWP